MKTKELLTKAEEEIRDVNERRVLDILKTSIARIKSAKKILKLLEQKHKELLEKDIDNFEEDMSY